MDALGQTHHLLRQLTCRLELPPVNVKQTQSKQHGEELGSLPQLLTQFPGPGVGFFHLRGRIALDRDQGIIQGEL